MNTPDHVETLLSAWQQGRAAGREPALNELCKDCPDLAPRLAARIAILRQMSALGREETGAYSNPGSETRDDLIPQRIGEYHILTRLGRGGMGTVYWAEDDRLKRPTAVKVMKQDLANRPGARERFLREARAAAAVEHEALVPIWHAGEDNGQLYLAMPLLRGESLADRLTRAGRLLPAEVARIARDVAEGLQAIHAAGMVHRDIKPANIWLSAKDEKKPKSDAFARARILDFGLARIDSNEDPQLTGTGDVIGTPAYMAPEQARGRPVDGRADLFSLGCVLYHAATGKPPFQAATVMATLAAVAEHVPPDPRSVSKTLPEHLVAIIHDLMAKRPAERPASAAEVVKRLQAKEDPKREQSRRFPTRRTLWITVVVAASLALVGVTLYSIFGGKGKPRPPEGGSNIGDYATLESSRIPTGEKYGWQTNDLVAVVGGHFTRIGPDDENTRVKFSPDGNWIAWSSSSGLRVWDANTLQLKATDLVAPLADPAFSWNSQKVAIACSRPSFGTYGFRQIELTGIERPPIRTGVGFRPGLPITALAYFQDIDRIATGNAAGAIEIWNYPEALKVPKSHPLLEIQAAHEKTGYPVRQILTAADDNRLVALCRDEHLKEASVRSWLLRDSAWSGTLIQPASTEVRRIDVTPTGDRVVIPIPKRTKSELELWYTAGKKGRAYATTIPTAGCRSVEFLNGGSKSQGAQLWLGHEDGSAKYWFMDLSKKSTRGLTGGRDLPLNTLAVSQDLKRKLYRTANGQLMVQDSLGNIERSGPVPVSDATHPAVLIGGRLLTQFPKPQVWHVTDGQFTIGESVEGLNSVVSPVTGSPAISFDGSAFAWRVGDAVQIYSTSSDAIRKLPLLQRSSPVVAFAWSAADGTIRTAHRDGVVAVWDLSKNPPVSTSVGMIPPAIRDKEYSLAASGIVAYHTSPTTDRTVRSYNLVDPASQPVEICRGTGPRIWPSPRGNRIITDENQGIAVWDLGTGIKRIWTQLPARPTAVQWAEDDQHVLVTMEGTLYVLRLKDSDTVGRAAIPIVDDDR